MHEHEIAAWSELIPDAGTLWEMSSLPAK